MRTVAHGMEYRTDVEFQLEVEAPSSLAAFESYRSDLWAAAA